MVVPLSEVERAYQQAKAGDQSTPALTIATLPSLAGGVVGDRVALFQSQYADVRITVLEQKHNQIPGAVLRRRVDFGIGSFLEPDAALDFTLLFQDQLSLIAPPFHSIHERSATWASLSGMHFVLLTGGPTEQALRTSRVTPAHILNVDQAPTAMAMV